MSAELREVRDFLAAHEPFSRLPAAEVDRLPAQLTMRYVRRGTRLLTEGEVNDGMFILRSGAVDVLAGEVLIDRRGEGDYFGYSTLVGEPESLYQMVTVEDSLVLVMPREVFAGLHAAHPVLRRYFDSATRRMRAAVDELNDTRFQALSTPVAELMHHGADTVGPGESIAAAARAMEEARSSSLLVTDSGRLAGILTDRDLRGRVLAAGVDPNGPVAEVMTPDPVTVAHDEPALAALLTLARLGVNHLPVVDGAELVGVITTGDVMALMRQDPVYLAADLARAAAPGDLTGAFNHAAEVTARFVERGTGGAETGTIMTALADAVAVRLCELAEAELGTPPVDYAFVVLGSQGRGEMMLASDQDNALILADDFDEAAHGAYFARLAEYVCHGLDAAGQVLCPGEMMALNPEWRMTARAWEETFTAWATAPGPDALLHAQTFFDLRAVHGDERLAARVRASAVIAAKGSRRLHVHLATLAARRQPPLSFFRGLVVERGGDYASTLDVKKGGLHAVVQIARLSALAAGSTATATRRRLSEGDLSEAGARDLTAAFDCLQAIALRRQAAQLRAGEAPDYHIDPARLARTDRDVLRDSFQVIRSAQNGLATRYPVHAA
ncbi:DUF294 nucleotidyltransferase-like domain-containing protein [Corynebacterium frankenforstense]